MNLLQLSRHPFFSILMVSLTLFASCNQYDTDLNINHLNAYDLEVIHKNIQRELTNADNLNSQYKTTSSEEIRANKLYLENAEYLNNHSLMELFEKNNLDTEIIKELQYFEVNFENEFIYQELIDNFNIDNELEATVLFSIIEVQKFVENKMMNSSSMTLNKTKAVNISWGCALAIAGTVGATVGFIGVTGGTGLLYALAMKGLATAALIEACGDGWGDI